MRDRGSRLAVRLLVMATPAISDGTLYFRARHHVVAITEPPPPERQRRPRRTLTSRISDQGRADRS